MKKSLSFTGLIMKQDFRIEKISQVIERAKSSDSELLSQEIMWEGSLKTFKVYNIPLGYLVYNKYNGRILSRTKSLEQQKHSINVEEPEGKELIANLLWQSKLDRNMKTEKSLRASGQQKVGIITKDGVIIDGNRRAMLLNRIDPHGLFKAIVLPVTLEEDPIQIERLETTYQMGEDEKLSYNPTEKYLKAKQIYDRLINSYTDEQSIKTISEWMNEPINEVKKYLETISVMDEYLEYLEYDGIYTQLDGREDQFLSLSKWLNNFYDESSKRAFDGYSDLDVDDLKYIAFDYIRIKNEYDGKEFRNLGEGNSENHFFGNRDIWNSFKDKHFEVLDMLPNEEDPNCDSESLDKHLNARNKLFYNKSKFDKDESAFIENLNMHKEKLGNNKAANEPEKLVYKALQTFEAIKTQHDSFTTPEVQELVKKLGEKVFDSMLDKSPISTLSHIVDLLNSINISDIPEKHLEDAKLKCKEIQKKCYRFEKTLR